MAQKKPNIRTDRRTGDDNANYGNKKTSPELTTSAETNQITKGGSPLETQPLIDLQTLVADIIKQIISHIKHLNFTVTSIQNKLSTGNTSKEPSEDFYQQPWYIMS